MFGILNKMQCACGKVCKSAGGLKTHQRSCTAAAPVERVRPIDFDDQLNPKQVTPMPPQAASQAGQADQVDDSANKAGNDGPVNDGVNLVEHAAISNREALKDKIHEIHNYLRNHGAGYGMNALKVFNIVYGLKKIEEAGLIDKAELKRPECEFSYILKYAKALENERVDELIYTNSLDAIAAGPLREMLLYELPRSIRPEVLSWLVREVEKIAIIEKTCNVLLSGKVYEYFIGRDATAISELGAYFTDRHIVDFIMRHVNPELIDGQVPTMTDMFGGSGGFTTGYINYLNEHNESINWETEVNKIYHSDINQDVLKSAALEIFCLTGQIPDMIRNVSYRNAFQHEFNGSDDKPRKYKYVLTNPPYGGDKQTKTGAAIKRDKIRDYINRTLPLIKDAKTKAERNAQLVEIDKQNKREKYDAEKARVTLRNCSARIQKFAHTYSVTANDKESCSLILLMDTVETGGVGVGVLKEGVFFNRLYADLRRCLVRNFAVREVISVEADQFENTSTKTSILIFSNTGPTCEVRFSKLNVSRYTEDKFGWCNGSVCLVENSGDISDVYTELTSIATIGEILKNPMCSLNGRDYNKPVLNIGLDYKMIKLGDVCQSINKKYTLDKKEYNYVEISDLVDNQIINYNTYKTDLIPNRATNRAEYGNILIACVRPKPSKITLIHSQFKNLDQFVFSSALANIQLKNPRDAMYVYAIICTLSANFEKELCIGSTYPRFSPDQLQNLQFPIPKDAAKLALWVARISEPYDAWQAARAQIEIAESDIAAHITQITSGECDQFELGTLCEYIKTGKNKTPDDKQGTKYPYYGTSEITGYTDYFLFDGPHILVARNGTMGNCFIVNGKIYPSDHIFVIRNNKNISIMMLYYIIKSLSLQIQSKSNGSVIKGISKENLSTLQIKMPKNKQLIADLDSQFAQLEQLQESASAAYAAYQKLSAELSAEAMPSADASDSE